MTPTPTLDPQRTDQLRTFLVTEAAADAAASSPAHRPHRMRFAVGITAAVLLAGAITVGTSLSGTGSERADAVAIEQADGWTTVRLVDVDADPQAVVDELTAAGIEARVADPDEAGISADAPGVTGLSAESTDGSFGVGMVSAVPPAAGSPSEAPGEVAAPVESGDVAVAEGEVTGPAPVVGPLPGGDGAELGPEGTEALDQQLEDAGIRFGDGGDLSIRNDAEVRVLVYRS